MTIGLYFACDEDGCEETTVLWPSSPGPWGDLEVGILGNGQLTVETAVMDLPEGWDLVDVDGRVRCPAHR